MRSIRQILRALGRELARQREQDRKRRRKRKRLERVAEAALLLGADRRGMQAIARRAA